MVKLLPCPFCGGTAVLEKMGWPHHVFCIKCGAKTTGTEYAEYGERQAIEKWNKRVNQDDLSKMLDKLLENKTEQKFFVDSDGKITPLPIQKHGHWISVPDKSPKTTTINMYSFICSCSECGQSVGHHIEYNYCPRCGAKMDEEVKQDG